MLIRIMSQCHSLPTYTVGPPAPCKNRKEQGTPSQIPEIPQEYTDCHRRSNKSPATKKKNTTEMTPFMVKKAALSFERSWGETSECS